MVQLSSEQRQLVDKLLDQATGSTETGGFQVALFQLLIPNRLKEPLAGSTRLRLLVDEHAARYPWELLSEPSQAPGESSFALRSGLIRSISFREFRAVPAAATSSHSALVVGDPTVTSYPSLLGASAESHAVLEVLVNHGLTVRSLIGGSAIEVISALFDQPYKIVHIAARASYVSGRPGLVIGDDIWLTPLEFAQMQFLPELVFINFGHVGHIDDETQPRSLGPLAAAFAAALIREGVSALIVSGSVVDDAACVTFTTAFYSALLVGEPFGVSVQRARLLTHELHPNATT